MNTLEALQKRKSVRGYLDIPVEDEKLKSILKYGNKAPNAGPFHMSVIRDKAFLDELNGTVAVAVAANGNEFMKKRFSIPGYKATYGAPVLVLISAPEGPFSAVNAACAATNMGIAATELGLGTCYLAGILMAFQVKPEYLSRAGVPDGYRPQCGLIIGYESERQIPGMQRKEDLSNVSFID